MWAGNRPASSNLALSAELARKLSLVVGGLPPRRPPRTRRPDALGPRRADSTDLSTNGHTGAAPAGAHLKSPENSSPKAALQVRCSSVRSKMVLGAPNCQYQHR